MVILAGSIIIVFGVIFIGQSRNILGPSYSFMYGNPDWTTVGFIAVAIGIITFSSGLFYRFTRRSYNKE